MPSAPDPLDREFLPLPIAALVAYYRVTELRRRLPEDHVGETVRLMAMALAAVTPIYAGAPDRDDAHRLNAAEIDALLAQPLGWGAGPELDHLCIRKSDMQHGIETLKASSGWRKS